MKSKISENRSPQLASYYLIKLMYFFKYLFDDLLLPLVARNFMVAKLLVNFAKLRLSEESADVALLQHLLYEFLSVQTFAWASFVVSQFKRWAFGLIRRFPRMTVLVRVSILKDWTFWPWFMLFTYWFLCLYFVNKFLNVGWLRFHRNRTMLCALSRCSF